MLQPLMELMLQQWKLTPTHSTTISHGAIVLSFETDHSEILSITINTLHYRSYMPSAPKALSIYIKSAQL